MLGKVNRTIITPPIRIVITPDDIYDIYVDFNDDLELDIYVDNLLIRVVWHQGLLDFCDWSKKET